METFKEYIEKLDKLEFEKMYENDFFLTWEKTRDELEAVFTVADTLRYLRENNISTKIFDWLGDFFIPRQLYKNTF